MLLASLLTASFVIFAALYLAPGNPVTALSGGRAIPVLTEFRSTVTAAAD